MPQPGLLWALTQLPRVAAIAVIENLLAFAAESVMPEQGWVYHAPSTKLVFRHRLGSEVEPNSM
jgi:hypothetical protein